MRQMSTRWRWFILALGLGVGCGTVALEPIDRGAPVAGGTSAAGGSMNDGGGGASADAACAWPDGGAPRTGPDKRVRDMTQADAEAWCQSYVFQRYPLASMNPPPVRANQDGPFADNLPDYVGGYAATYCWMLVPNGGCLTRPTVVDCVANLLHAPCEATLTALDDCVDSFFDLQNQCGPIGQGCAPFTQASHCDETVIMSIPEQPDGGGGFQECYLRISSSCN